MLVVDLIVLWIGIRFYSVECIIFVFICECLVVFVEIWIDWGEIFVYFVMVLVVGIGLLDFDECVWDWLGVFVKDLVV